jgi:hypothetical protein
VCKIVWFCVVGLVCALTRKHISLFLCVNTKTDCLFVGYYSAYRLFVVMGKIVWFCAVGLVCAFTRKHIHWDFSWLGDLSSLQPVAGICTSDRLEIWVIYLVSSLSLVSVPATGWRYEVESGVKDPRGTF